MSAMELFRSRIQQSAKAAAVELLDLDKMAQKDEYVQSEGLRLSTRKENTSTASCFSDNSVIEDMSGTFVDALSTAARKQNRPRPSTQPSHCLRRQSTLAETDSDKKKVTDRKKQPKPASQKPATTGRLIPSVAALYDQSNKQKNAADEKQMGTFSTSKRTLVPTIGKKTDQLLVAERHAKILHELDYFSETDSSDDDDDDDARKRQNNNSSSDIEMLEQELAKSISRQNSLKIPVGGTGEKDVHRFMKITADLESEREALLKSLHDLESPVTAPGSLGVKSTHGGAVGEKSTKTLQAGMSWVRNVATPQLEAISKQIMMKVSEVDASNKSRLKPSRGPMIVSPNSTQSSRKNDIDVDKITMRTSASFLADDDMAELEQIKMRNSSLKIIASIKTCIGNPRLAFIALTLVFALFVYFYSRHKSVDDVL